MAHITLLAELMKQYGLTGKDCNKPVSDSHLECISRSSCKHWKSLPAHLGLETITAEDSDRKYADPGSKRYDFFQKWQQMKGSGATYKQLVLALLIINCRQDAEAVCNVLKSSVPQLNSPNSASSIVPALPSSDAAGNNYSHR